MAWIYRRAGSANWWIGYRVGGKQFLKSTGTAKRADAQRELDKFEVLSVAKHAGALTQEFFNAIAGNAQPKVTLTAATTAWLAHCNGTTAPGTVERYRNVTDQISGYFKSDPLLGDVGADEIHAFLTDVNSRRSVGSVNLTRKILSVFFNYAVGRGFAVVNPVKATKRFTVAKGSKTRRRPFTEDEMRSVVRAAPTDFWKYMIVGAIYTGLSLGDLVVLRLSEIDGARTKLVMERGKTGVEMNIPIALPFLAEIRARLATRKNWKPSDYLWPDEAALYMNDGGKPNAGPFSKAFYEDVMVPAGLAEKRTHKKRDRGDENHGRRAVNELSFHSFRHTFISLLKLSGASQSVAKELAGHTSDAVSDLYTTIPIEVLSKAIAMLPEVTD